MTWLAIALGATVGAWLRWRLGLWLNTSGNILPLGTLLANLAGAYLIGVAIAFFEGNTFLSVEWRLLVMTGFLGSLTTFSTFSAEAMGLLMRGDYLWVFAHSALHLLGSIALCIAGFASYRWLAG